MIASESESANATPASLLLALRRPSEARAWHTFVELYTPLIYRWARGAGLREPDAADLVQDVFVLLLAKLPEFRYDRHGSFRPGCAPSYSTNGARTCAAAASRPTS